MSTHLASHLRTQEVMGTSSSKVIVEQFALNRGPTNYNVIPTYAMYYSVRDTKQVRNKFPF